MSREAGDGPSDRGLGMPFELNLSPRTSQAAAALKAEVQLGRSRGRACLSRPERATEWAPVPGAGYF